MTRVITEKAINIQGSSNAGGGNWTGHFTRSRCILEGQNMWLNVLEKYFLKPQNAKPVLVKMQCLELSSPNRHWLLLQPRLMLCKKPVLSGCRDSFLARPNIGEIIPRKRSYCSYKVQWLGLVKQGRPWLVEKRAMVMVMVMVYCFIWLSQ